MQMKQLFIILTLLFTVFIGYGQTTTIDFETAGSGYTPSTTSGGGFTDVFNRTNPNIGGNSTYMWSVEDLPVTNPYIDIDQIDITGSSSFVFSIDMLAHHYNDWDDSDELLITYSIDGGTYQNLMWVQNSGGSFNEAASLDIDFDGNGDCGSGILPALTTGTSGCTVTDNTFQTFNTSSIALSGNTSLDIRLQFNGLDANDEGIYLDNIVITEVGGTTSPTITVSPISLTGLDYSEGLGPSAEQSFTVEGSNLTGNITLTPPANFEISTGTGGSFVATNPITLTQSGGTVASTTIYVRLAAGLGDNTYGSSNITVASTGATTQNVSVSGEVIRPVITVSPSTLTGLDYVFGSGPSAEQTFTISGINLSDDITVSAAATNNFEISTSSGTGFGTTVTLSPTSETVSSTTIYVRLKTGLAVNTYGASNITANSTYATTQNVSVSGEVTEVSNICSSDNFNSGYGNWSGGSGTYINTTAGLTGDGVGFNSTNDNIVTSSAITNPQTLTFWLASSSSSSNKTLSIQYSTSSSGPWTTVRDILNSEVTITHQEFTINLNLTGDYYFNIEMTQRSGNSYYLDDVEVNCASTTPTIITSTDTLFGLDYTFGSGPSAEQSFTVEGTDLTADITLTAPTNFQISTSSGSGFGSSLTLTETGGSVTTTTIYVSLVASLGWN